ncbi:MAG: bifunctional methylenetetrahydrofolate dehydrogenase/methenyltetrahydrofolate cyclohydrolase FolD [Clostridia bacterium]|nr:bifunctional methylenetetrahydrofolate dehydrogenase/methenyltetrahydrofolate cyclohydrolase FolD [Clostridia bacterium]
MAKILDGKAVSLANREEIKRDVASFIEKTGVTPCLAVVIVGEDPASKVYVRNKHKGCLEVGMRSIVCELPYETTEDELLSIIDGMNSDPEVHGILVQLPVPKHIDEKKIINKILPEKDVDAFHPVNVGKIMIGDFDFLPCTPAGVMNILSHYGIEIEGKHCVVIGRSNTVGKPQAMLMLHKNATVSVCHSRTRNLAEITKTADILVAAVGRADFVTKDMVKEGAVVIDVGINRCADGTLHGDVDFKDVFDKVEAITPVPGGVGPMTITMLLRNTLTAAEKLTK